MQTCTLCSPVAKGYVIEFDQDTDQASIFSRCNDDRAMRSCELIGQDQLWVNARSVSRHKQYWTEFCKPSAWRFRKAKRLVDGTVETGDVIEWVEVLLREPQVWIDDLIRDGRIRMAYQSIVSVENGVRIVGYETLARATGESGDAISPVVMFQQAREQDRLFALDRACRIKAVEAAKKVPSDALVFVNFIPTSIYKPEHCLQTTMLATRRHDIDPSRLVFEVIETDAVRDPEHLKTIFNYYHSYGVQCALDDVGAGFNNVEMLEALAPDIVKLDRSIVDGIAQDPQKQEVALRILDAAEKVGAVALGEGVEEVEDALCLREMGYVWQQGYLYGRPSFDVLRPAIARLTFQKAA